MACVIIILLMYLTDGSRFYLSLKEAEYKREKDEIVKCLCCPHKVCTDVHIPHDWEGTPPILRASPIWKKVLLKCQTNPSSPERYGQHRRGGTHIFVQYRNIGPPFSGCART